MVGCQSCCVGCCCLTSSSISACKGRCFAFATDAGRRTVPEQFCLGFLGQRDQRMLSKFRLKVLFFMTLDLAVMFTKDVLHNICLSRHVTWSKTPCNGVKIFETASLFETKAPMDRPTTRWTSHHRSGD